MKRDQRRIIVDLIKMLCKYWVKQLFCYVCKVRILNIIVTGKIISVSHIIIIVMQ